MNELALLPDPLLATKFFVPTAPHALVDRQRLHLRLHQGLQRKLTLVSAPAGFGKTTLVSSWLHALPKGDPVVAWLSLDAQDNHPQRFWTYVLTAVERRSPGVSRQALAALQAPEVPPLTGVLTTFLNDLMALPMPIVLVLDDYDLITDGAIHRSLLFLIEHLPPHVHLLLLTRSDPPLALARLRSHGHVLEVRSDELRCTPDEMHDVLDAAMGIPLADGDARRELATRTEGWLAGLQLLGLSLQARGDVATVLAEISGSHHYIVDYLTEEVLSQQPPDVQHFLLHTALLDRLSAALCDAVLDGTPAGRLPTAEGAAVDQTGAGRSSQELLEYLERANLFVVPLDMQRRWYRYHQLFAEALRYRLEQLHPELVPILHRRASDWYAAHGNLGQAVQHALSAQAWERAAELLEPVIATEHWRDVSVPQVERWLAQLPEAVVRSRPRLCAVYGRTLGLSGRLAESERWLQLAADDGRADPQPRDDAGFDQSQPAREALLGEAEAPHHPTTLALVAPRVAEAGALVEPLSEREREVLHLMAAGASNQEIGERLIVALNTAKRHVSNIMGKLGASNRTQAVAHARALKLLGDTPEHAGLDHLVVPKPVYLVGRAAPTAALPLAS